MIVCGFGPKHYCIREVLATSVACLAISGPELENVHQAGNGRAADRKCT